MQKKGWFKKKYEHKLARMGIPTKRPKFMEPRVPLPVEDGYETAEYFIGAHLYSTDDMSKLSVDKLIKEFKSEEIHGHSKITPEYLSGAKWYFAEWLKENQ
jgi:hypothetical protein